MDLSNEGKDAIEKVYKLNAYLSKLGSHFNINEADFNRETIKAYAYVNSLVYALNQKQVQLKLCLEEFQKWAK